LNNRTFLIKITEKWPVKVLSVAAALIISVFYRMNTLETRYFSVPLVVETNDSFIAVNSFVNSVRINLRGEGSSIHTIFENDIIAYIDLDKYKNDGTYKAPVQIRKKGSALGIEPLEITVIPIEISVTMEEKISRDIPVYPVITGSPAYDFELTEQSIIPEIVTVDGPHTSIESIINFFTEVIDLEGRNDTFSVIVNIINDNPLVTIQGNRSIVYHGTILPISRELTENETGEHEQ
jgi:YbbR domain-containing protein